MNKWKDLRFSMDLQAPGKHQLLVRCNQLTTHYLPLLSRFYQITPLHLALCLTLLVSISF